MELERHQFENWRQVREERGWSWGDMADQADRDGNDALAEVFRGYAKDGEPADATTPTDDGKGDADEKAPKRRTRLRGESSR